MNEFQSFRSLEWHDRTRYSYYDSAESKSSVCLTGDSFDRFFQMYFHQTLVDSLEKRTVVLEEGAFTVSENEVKSVSLSADRRMATLTLAHEMKQEGKYRLNVLGVKDDAGNGKALRTAFIYFENQEIPASIGISGGSDFNMSFCLKTNKSDVFFVASGKGFVGKFRC